MSERDRIEQYANGSITVEGMANDIGGSEARWGTVLKMKRPNRKAIKPVSFPLQQRGRNQAATGRWY